MNKEFLRQEFEKEAINHVTSLDRDIDGNYIAKDASAAWWAWQHQSMANNNSLALSNELNTIWENLIGIPGFEQELAKHENRFKEQNFTLHFGKYVIQLHAESHEEQGNWRIFPSFQGVPLLNARYLQIPNAELIERNEIDKLGYKTLNVSENEFGVFKERFNVKTSERFLSAILYLENMRGIIFRPLNDETTFELAIEKVTSENGEYSGVESRINKSLESLNKQTFDTEVHCEQYIWNISDPTEIVKNIYDNKKDLENQTKPSMEFVFKFDSDVLVESYLRKSDTTSLALMNMTMAPATRPKSNNRY